MKTVVIYNDNQFGVKFFTLEGDYKHLDRVSINSGTNEHAESELSDLLFNSKGHYKVVFEKVFPINDVKEGAFVIVCEFLP